MVSELLRVGGSNAITGRELAAVLGCDIRTVTAAVERERRDGSPICANLTGKYAGYYLAADEIELQDYCGRLKHRADELTKTRLAMQN